MISQQEFQTFLHNEMAYTDVRHVMTQVRKHFRFHSVNTKYKYFNVPIAFDIEASSFYKNGEKHACMYAWTLNIAGLAIIGRTWEHFQNCINDLVDILNLDYNKRRIIIYVHNLAYDFQFFRKYFDFEKVFAIASRKPIYAVTSDGVEFRCSYLLSGYSLEKVGEHLHTYHVRKLKGYLDYDKIRHNKTLLIKEERQYLIADGKVVVAYIQECIEDEKGIANIPLTNTGYVRRYCRNKCFYEDGKGHSKSKKRYKYKSMINALTLDADSYTICKRAFQGGYTHANAKHANQILYNVASYDFTSSYPAVMLSEKFPMTSPEKIENISEDDFKKSIQYYCCMFDIEYVNIRQKESTPDSYISYSRCFYTKNPEINNGRIYQADCIRTTITEQDFFIIEQAYNYDCYRVSNFYRFKRDYLPKDFILAILKLYEDKTTLKDVECSEVEYLRSKGMLNSCYGMAVTDIVRTIYVYTDEWQEPIQPDFTEELEKYNKQMNRFLYYPWGVWVTAYARRNLWTGILTCGDDYIYSDTDSIKILNADKHHNYFEWYNKRIEEKLNRMLEHYNLDVELIKPKTIKGVEKLIGVWDYEGDYSRFKTLGAKRYLTEHESKIEMTVAGVSKKSVQYINDDKFENFNDGLEFIPEQTGKLTHTYIDYEISGTITDYMGILGEYQELSCIHMEKAPFKMSLTQTYVDFIIKLMKGI